ncbi:type II toxin-antitoxin system HicB family antitoxin [Thermoleptolyngbya oregonensis]|uniref:type II toxin-antitoxin system HicB family antitoxin n=1 Tax=Thermoleptolyngbya oregonensis TaxID=2303529 RepID=UPI00292F74D3|nr:type II toxin-antitoxin system HicB family antitoxin [Thermoleptolyngbya oregonensis]
MSTLLNYRGYTAKVDYDPEAEVLHGTVLDLRDAIVFQAKEIKDVKRNFHDAVDQYLSLMERTGQEPEKPFKGNIAFRTSSATHKKISLAAARADMSINAWMDQVLSEAADAELKGYRYERGNAGHVNQLVAVPLEQAVATSTAVLLTEVLRQDGAIAPQLVSAFNPYASRKDPHASLEIMKSLDLILRGIAIDRAQVQEGISKLLSLTKSDDVAEVPPFVLRAISDQMLRTINLDPAAPANVNFSLHPENTPVINT